MADFFKLSHFFVFCFLLFFILLLIIRWSSSNSKVIILLLIFFLVGFWRFQLALPDFRNPQNIYYYNNQQVFFSGVVVKINSKIDYQEIILKVQSLAGTFSYGQVMLNLPLYPEYHYGEILKVNCKLKPPNNYPDFDYGRYLSKFNVYSICAYPNITITGQTQNNFEFKLFSVVYFIKSQLSQSLDSFVPEPESSLLQAMILGIKGELPDNLKTIFSNVGLSHIIAISGMHIVILTLIISQLTIGLGVIRTKAFWVTLIVIIFYVAMIGFPPSAVRGASMALLFLYAQKIGRISYSINALLLSAGVMLLINPKLLLYDVGFQLSFTAVLGLLYLMPILKSKLKHWPEFGQIKNILITTLSAQIMTQPLIIFYFHKVSLISVLANILVLPFLPFLMIGVFINLLLGLVYPVLGYYFGYVSYFLTHYIILVASYLDQWSLASLKLAVTSLPLTIIFYLAMVFFILKQRRYLN